jgi:hypothetical protein
MKTFWWFKSFLMGRIDSRGSRTPQNPKVSKLDA